MLFPRLYLTDVVFSFLQSLNAPFNNHGPACLSRVADILEPSRAAPPSKLDGRQKQNKIHVHPYCFYLFQFRGINNLRKTQSQFLFSNLKSQTPLPLIQLKHCGAAETTAANPLVLLHRQQAKKSEVPGFQVLKFSTPIFNVWELYSGQLWEFMVLLEVLKTMHPH